MGETGAPVAREPWQDAYQFGALYVFPPRRVAEQVDALRERYDPRSAASCGAHVSLSNPLPARPSERELAELAHALRSLQPFEMHYGPLCSYPPHPGVAYEVQPEARFHELRMAVHATSLFAEVELRHTDTPPHMTVAEFISLERTERLARELPPLAPTGSFVCDAVTYAVPNSDFYFEPLITLPLGSG